MLDGSEVGSGLILAGTNCTVRGLVLNNFTQAVRIANSDDTVEGNFIGLDNTGSYASIGSYEAFGIICFSESNVGGILIGGSSPDARNVIAGFEANIELIGAVTVAVTGNYIGTNAAGTALPIDISSTTAYSAEGVGV